ncbi:hypothetical protein GCM10028809_32050 [Spirosoma gilvum]
MPTGPRFRLKKEVEQFGVGLSRGRLQTTTYSYNGRGNVASFTMVTQDNYYGKLDTASGVLTYDAHHRLIKCTTKITHVGSYIYYEVAQTEFSYDTKGDMTLIKAYGAQVVVGKQPPSPLPFVAQSTFTYNYDHQPIKEIYEKNKAVSPYIDQYKYIWKDGNIVESNFSTTDSLLATNIDTIKLSYDAQVNPYFSLYFRSGIRELTYGFWAGTLWGSGLRNGYITNIYLLARNNLLIDNQRLIYNDQGLLIKRIGNENNRNFYFFINYEYEEY